MTKADDFDAAFDRIMESVGYRGAFQLRFNIIFNILLVVFASLAYNSMIFTFATPEHWCFVPGRENTNLSMAEWRDATVPRIFDSPAEFRYSKCTMFELLDGSNVTIAGVAGQLGNYDGRDDALPDNRSTIGCQYGWTYDKQWYETTAVSQENWVCEKDMYQSNTFAMGRFGEVIGSLVVGQFGDRIGRRLTFYISLVVLLIGKIGMVYAVSNYTLLTIAAIVGSLTINATFQAPLIIAMEASPAERRALIAMTQNVAWSVANCLMPLLFWWIREWRLFIWLTILPMVVFLWFPGYMIESPRWLATSGRLAECAKYLTVIARINGRPDSEITETELKKMLPDSSTGTGSGQVYSILSLFTGRRIAQNTLLMVFAWVVCMLGYYTLVLSVADLPGNPFVNFLVQSLVEFPAYIVGQRLCNTIGRRLTNSLMFVNCSVLSLAIVLVINYASNAGPYLTAITFVMKFFVSMTFYAVYLQSVETYPTCLRQTGTSLGIVASNTFGMLGPYIVYLGKNIDATLPYWILFGLFIVGTLCALFSTETLNQKLPDSLEDAMHFGADQRFWSFPWSKRKCDEDESAQVTEELNQIKYAP